MKHQPEQKKQLPQQKKQQVQQQKKQGKGQKKHQQLSQQPTELAQQPESKQQPMEHPEQHPLQKQQQKQQYKQFKQFKKGGYVDYDTMEDDSEKETSETDTWKAAAAAWMEARGKDPNGSKSFVNSTQSPPQRALVCYEDPTPKCSRILKSICSPVTSPILPGPVNILNPTVIQGTPNTTLPGPSGDQELYKGTSPNAIGVVSGPSGDHQLYKLPPPNASLNGPSGDHQLYKLPPPNASLNGSSGDHPFRLAFGGGNL